VVPADAYLQFGRANHVADTAMVPLAGNPPGSVLDVKPHAAQSFALPMTLLFAGVFGGTGAAVAVGQCHGGKCSDAVQGVLIGTAIVGAGAFVTGLVMTLTTHVIATVDVTPRKSALRAAPDGASLLF
jgi:hypothetical protein